MADKTNHYATLIVEQIKAMFSENSDNYINADELAEGDNFNAFLFALTSLAPCAILNGFTDEGPKTALELNHVANKLCFQFCKNAEN